MNKKGPREIFFVCSGINAGELISKTILASSHNEASKIFKAEYLISPQEIHGPFHKKRSQVIESTREIKFSNVTKKAIYDDWYVTAFYLKEPENQALLMFIKRTDDKKMTKPQGTITVPISELRLI
jgi:hypothetical protein